MQSCLLNKRSLRYVLETSDRWKARSGKGTGIALMTGVQNIGPRWVITEKIDHRLREGIAAGVSVAVSNIKANEQILTREREKSTLLFLSREMAAFCDRNGLFLKRYSRVTAVFGSQELGRLLLDQQKQTYRA